MPIMNFDDFVAFAKTLDAKNLRTIATGKEFNLKVIDDGLQYTPKSTNKPRRHEYKFPKRVFDRFKKIQSFQPKDYIDITVNASYTLTVIKKYVTTKEIYDVEDIKALEGYQSDKKYLYTKRNKGIVEKRKIKDKYTCQACKFRLKIHGKYIIECHHIIPLANTGKRITNIKELICLCPTCHRIAHTRRPSYSLKEIIEILKKNA